MVETKYYTTPNNQDFVDDIGFPRLSVENNKVFAKAVREIKKKNILDRSPSHFRYYVKIEPNRALHNPFDKIGSQNSRPSFIDKVCKSENSFMEVNQSVFDKYINYLKTQNNKWLVDAQREVR